MNKYFSYLFFFLIMGFCIIACSPVKAPVTNEYKLEKYSARRLASQFSPVSILITLPEAVTGYQTQDMLYVNKAYELSPFAHNAWIGPPADMLFPLLMQSIQRSGYFYAVASSPNASETDYRLDTQLLNLEQIFLTKPSQIHFACKIVLTHVSDNRVVASGIIDKKIPCADNTPYAGVLAANKAVEMFTAEATAFVVHHTQRDQSKHR